MTIPNVVPGQKIRSSTINALIAGIDEAAAALPGGEATGDELAVVDGVKGWRSRAYVDVRDFVDSADAGNYSLAVNRAMAAVVSDLGGRGDVILPNRAEAYQTTIVPVSNVTLRGGGSATELIQSGAIDLIKPATGTIGTKTNLTANALAGSTVIALSTGGGASFAAGDLLLLQSTTVNFGVDQRTRDIRKVISVSGDNLTLSGALLHDYLTSATAQWAKVTPKRGFTVADLLVTNPNPGTNTGYAIRFDQAIDVRIESVSVDDGGGGIVINDTLDVHISNVTIDRLRNGTTINPGFAANGYGILLSGATSGVLVNSGLFRGTRHAITTIGMQDGVNIWGGPRDCVFSNVVSYQAPDGLTHFDTHEGGINLTFANCIADGGGEAGFQVRAKDVTLANCRAIRCGTRGINNPVNGDRMRVEGGEISYSTLNGISISSVDSKIVGTEIHHGHDYGIVVGTTATNPLIMDCYIHDNGQGVAAPGIADQGATNLRAIGNVIPSSVTQNLGIFGLSATGYAAQNILRGFANDSTAFFGANAAAVFRGNETDNGGVRLASADYTMGPYDRIVRMTTAATGRTVTLPLAASMKGELVTVIKDDAGAATVTIDGNGSETINGATTLVLAATQFKFATLVCDGLKWLVVASN